MFEEQEMFTGMKPEKSATATRRVYSFCLHLSASNKGGLVPPASSTAFAEEKSHWQKNGVKKMMIGLILGEKPCVKYKFLREADGNLFEIGMRRIEQIVWFS